MANGTKKAEPLYKVVTELGGESVRALPKASAERVVRSLGKARKGWYPAIKAWLLPA